MINALTFNMTAPLAARTPASPQRGADAPVSHSAGDTVELRSGASSSAPTEAKRSRFGRIGRSVALAAGLGAVALGATGCAVTGTYRDPYNPHIVHERTTVFVPGVGAATSDIPYVVSPPIMQVPVVPIFVPVYRPQGPYRPAPHQHPGPYNQPRRW